MKKVDAWITDDGLLFGDVGLAEAHEAEGAVTMLGAATAGNIAEALSKAHAGEPAGDLEAAIMKLSALFWGARNSATAYRAGSGGAGGAPAEVSFTGGATGGGLSDKTEQVTQVEARAGDQVNSAQPIA